MSKHKEERRDKKEMRKKFKEIDKNKSPEEKMRISNVSLAPEYSKPYLGTSLSDRLTRDQVTRQGMYERATWNNYNYNPISPGYVYK